MPGMGNPYRHPPACASRVLVVLACVAAILVPSTAASASAPGNDSFRNAKHLTRPIGVSWSTTIGATRQLGEPRHGGYAGLHSVWWRYTAPYNGRLQVTALAGT